MSLKPAKKSDLNKSWMQPRRDRRKLIQPEFEIMLANNDYIRMGDEEFKFWIR